MQRRGWLLIRLEMLLDQRDRSVRILKHNSILQSQNGQAGRTQEPRTQPVMRSRVCAIVRGTVKFDNQFLARTVEVDDIRADAVLPPEFPPVQPGPLKDTPKRSFSGSQTRPECPSPLDERLAIMKFLPR